MLSSPAGILIIILTCLFIMSSVIEAGLRAVSKSNHSGYYAAPEIPWCPGWLLFGTPIPLTSEQSAASAAYPVPLWKEALCPQSAVARNNLFLFHF